MKKLLIAFLLFTGMNLSAQKALLAEGAGLEEFSQGLGLSDSRLADLTSLFVSRLNESVDLSGIKGSPNIYEDWKGGVFIHNGQKRFKTEFRYNMSSREMEIYPEFAIQPGDGDFEVLFNDGTKFIYKGTAWLEVTSYGYINHTVKFMPRTYATTSYERAFPNRWVYKKKVVDKNFKELSKRQMRKLNIKK